MNINEINLIAYGNTAEIYEVDKTKIIKLYRNDIPIFLCEHEYVGTQVAKSTIGNVPTVYEVINIDQRQGLIFERINGKDMLNILIKDLFKIKCYAIELAKIHMNMQKACNKTLPTVKEKLALDINTQEVLSLQEKNKILKYISSLPDGNTLCHFDFHPGNVIYSSDRPIIIDWMTACSGDKLADVARTSILLKYAEMPRGNFLIKKLAKILQKKIYQYYIAEYKRVTRVSQKDIDIWELPVLSARLCENIPKSEEVVLTKKIRELLNTL